MKSLQQVDIEILQRTLYSILLQQAPDLDASFVYRLHREQLIMIFDILMTQDMWERQKKWMKIEMVVQSVLSHTSSVLQRAKIFYLHLKEQQHFQQDQQDLHTLESSF